jgi:hypothetical protein
MFPEDLSDVEVNIEMITPDLAREYLEMNFSNNRSLTKTTVARYTALMKGGMWKLSTDAIGFDVEGSMVNGQHRLTAVIASDTDQPFVVLRGLPVENATVFDMGKRRMMHERLTVAGHQLSAHACAIIRNAMGDYNSLQTGTMKYSEQQSDVIVWEHYCKHRWAVDTLAGYSKQTSSLVLAAALKMFVHLANPHRIHRGPRLRVEAELTPMQLAEKFAEISAHGTSPTGTLPEDCAAILLHKAITEQRARGLTWAGATCFRVSVNAAYAFMCGNQMRSLRPRDNDPFVDLKLVDSTNPAGWSAQE